MIYPELPKSFSRVLAVVAHPDDAEIWCGGLLALAPWSGLLVLSRGEGNGDPAVRTLEQQRSGELLGLKCVDMRHEPDGFMTDSFRLRRTILDTIRHVQPQLVLTHAGWDKHADHRLVSKLVAAVINLTEKPSLSHIKPCPIPFLWLFNSDIPLPLRYTECVLDITDVMDVKERAINCHVSQRAHYPQNYPLMQARGWAEGTPFDYAERFYLSPYGRQCE